MLARSVRDYRTLAVQLLAEHPREQAMELAVGSSYDFIGDVEASALLEIGLTRGQHLIDLGMWERAPVSRARSAI